METLQPSLSNAISFNFFGRWPTFPQFEYDSNETLLYWVIIYVSIFMRTKLELIFCYHKTKCNYSLNIRRHQQQCYIMLPLWSNIRMVFCYNSVQIREHLIGSNGDDTVCGFRTVSALQIGQCYLFMFGFSLTVIEANKEY